MIEPLRGGPPPPPPPKPRVGGVALGGPMHMIEPLRSPPPHPSPVNGGGSRSGLPLALTPLRAGHAGLLFWRR
jgi:hypothetical protein